MSEYIEREKALSAQNKSMNLAECRKRLERIPAADVRPVVTCGECMYAPAGTDSGENQGLSLEWPHDDWPEDNPCPCKCEDGWYSHKPKPDFFCANGKREES